MKHTLKTGLFFALFSPLLVFAQAREPIDTDEQNGEIVVQTEQQSNYTQDQYPGIYMPISAHGLVSISAYEDTLELEDGSLWQVSTYDGRKAKRWYVDDVLSITQNTRWFSSYYYRITNRHTGASIEANLTQGPFINGRLTYYVTEFDTTRGIVTLSTPERSTRWEIHPSDVPAFQMWDFTQPIPVILGDNNDYTGYGDYKWECLLINVKQSKKYIRAHQF